MVVEELSADELAVMEMEFKHHENMVMLPKELQYWPQNCQFYSLLRQVLHPEDPEDAPDEVPLPMSLSTRMLADHTCYENVELPPKIEGHIRMRLYLDRFQARFPDGEYTPEIESPNTRPRCMVILRAIAEWKHEASQDEVFSKVYQILACTPLSIFHGMISRDNTPPSLVLAEEMQEDMNEFIANHMMMAMHALSERENPFMQNCALFAAFRDCVRYHFMRTECLIHMMDSLLTEAKPGDLLLHNGRLGYVCADNESVMLVDAHTPLACLDLFAAYCAEFPYKDDLLTYIRDGNPVGLLAQEIKRVDREIRREEEERKA